MARVRNMKPGFFKNEDLAECSPWARLCFAGLWTLADREGRLEDRAKRIKAELFAYDSIEVDPLLGELEKRGFILRYKAPDGRGLIQVACFAKHQNPHHREPKSELPSPQSLGLLVDANTIKPEALATCDEQKASDKPEACPRLDHPRNDLARGSSRAEQGTRNKDKEKARKRAPAAQVVSVETMVSEGVDPQNAADWLTARKVKRLPLTPTAWAATKAEAAKAGLGVPEAIKTAAAHGWGGFRASWLTPEVRRNGDAGRGGGGDVLADIFRRGEA